jgi:hypothetical protein
MVYPVTVEQAQALLESHVMSVRVECFSGGVSKGQVPIVDGEVTATFTSQINRNASLTVPRTVIDAGLLNPLTDHVMIYTGITNVVEIPIFFGRVDAHTRNQSGRVQVSLVDQSADVIRARFEQPWAALVGNNIPNEMTRMIIDVNSAFTVDSTNAPLSLMPAGLWEEDRGAALDEMATSINCIWQSDRTGGFVIYPNPYASTQPVPAVLELRDGSSGNLVAIEETVSREMINNSVTVIVERTDNTPPVRITVRDAGPTSPTRWGGVFGKQNMVRKIRSSIGAQEAAVVAIRMLSQSLALSRSWRISTPHFPLLDPGDVFSVVWDSVTNTQVVESITYPLMAIDDTSISARELRFEDEIEIIPETVTENAA